MAWECDREPGVAFLKLCYSREIMALHRLIPLENGLFTLSPEGTGQTMHSLVGPWAEAEQIYIRNSGLTRALGPGRDVRILDIGLGMATNALCALEAAERQGGFLYIESIENDLDGLRTMLGNAEGFPFARRHLALLRDLETRGEARTRSCEWRLSVGDYTKQGNRGAADFAFYDFYSPAYAPELWTRECFEKLSQCETLCTYSAATSVRGGLLEAGFYVGRAPGTSAKAEATIASRRLSSLTAPLGPDWLSRKSPELRARLAQHPQFQIS